MQQDQTQNNFTTRILTNKLNQSNFNINQQISKSTKMDRFTYQNNPNLRKQNQYTQDNNKYRQDNNKNIQTRMSNTIKVNINFNLTNSQNKSNHYQNFCIQSNVKSSKSNLSTKQLIQGKKINTQQSKINIVNKNCYRPNISTQNLSKAKKMFQKSINQNNHSVSHQIKSCFDFDQFQNDSHQNVQINYQPSLNKNDINNIKRKQNNLSLLNNKKSKSKSKSKQKNKYKNKSKSKSKSKQKSLNKQKMFIKMKKSHIKIKKLSKQKQFISKHINSLNQLKINTKDTNERKFSNSKSKSKSKSKNKTKIQTKNKLQNKISINYESPNQKTKRSNSNYSKSLSRTISRSKSKSANRSIIKSTKRPYEGLNKKIQTAKKAKTTKSKQLIQKRPTNTSTHERSINTISSKISVFKTNFYYPYKNLNEQKSDNIKKKKKQVKKIEKKQEKISLHQQIKKKTQKQTKKFINSKQLTKDEIIKHKASAIKQQRIVNIQKSQLINKIIKIQSFYRGYRVRRQFVDDLSFIKHKINIIRQASARKNHKQQANNQTLKLSNNSIQYIEQDSQTSSQKVFQRSTLDDKKFFKRKINQSQKSLLEQNYKISQYKRIQSEQFSINESVSWTNIQQRVIQSMQMNNILLQQNQKLKQHIRSISSGQGQNLISSNEHSINSLISKQSKQQLKYQDPQQLKEGPQQKIRKNSINKQTQKNNKGQKMHRQQVIEVIGQNKKQLIQIINPNKKRLNIEVDIDSYLPENSSQPNNSSKSNKYKKIFQFYECSPRNKQFNFNFIKSPKSTISIKNTIQLEEWRQQQSNLQTKRLQIQFEKKLTLLEDVKINHTISPTNFNLSKKAFVHQQKPNRNYTDQVNNRNQTGQITNRNQTGQINNRNQTNHINNRNQTNHINNNSHQNIRQKVNDIAPRKEEIIQLNSQQNIYKKNDNKINKKVKKNVFSFVEFQKQYQKRQSNQSIQCIKNDSKDDINLYTMQQIKAVETSQRQFQVNQFKKSNVFVVMHNSPQNQPQQIQSQVLQYIQPQVKQYIQSQVRQQISSQIRQSISLSVQESISLQVQESISLQVQEQMSLQVQEYEIRNEQAPQIIRGFDTSLLFVKNFIFAFFQYLRSNQTFQKRIVNNLLSNGFQYQHLLTCYRTKLSQIDGEMYQNQQVEGQFLAYQYWKNLVDYQPIIDTQIFQLFNTYLAQLDQMNHDYNQHFFVTDQHQNHFYQVYNCSLKQIQKVYLMLLMDILNQAFQRQRLGGQGLTDFLTIKNIKIGSFSALTKVTKILNVIQEIKQFQQIHQHQQNVLSSQIQILKKAKQQNFDGVICSVIKTILQNWGKTLCGLIFQPEEQNSIGVTRQQVMLKNQERLEVFLNKFLIQNQDDMKQKMKEHQICTKLIVTDSICSQLINQILNQLHFIQ